MINLIFSKVSKDALLLFTGNVIAAGFSIIFTIIAARMLGPENWGITAAVISFATIVIAFGDLGLTSALFHFLPKNANIVHVIFSVRSMTVIFLFLLLTLLSSVLSRILFKIDDPRLIIAAAIAIAGSLSLDFQIAIMEAKHNFKSAAIFISLTNVLRVALLSVLPALIAFSLSPVLLFIIYVIFKRGWNHFNKDSFDLIRQEWRKVTTEIIPFSSWMALNRVVSALSSRSDILILLNLGSVYQTGIFAASKQLALGIPIALGSFATVLAPRFATLQKEELTNFFNRTILLSVLISFGILVLAIFSGPIISLFGERYIGAENVLFWLLVGFLPVALSTPAVNLLIYSFNKPKIIAITSFIQMPLVLFGNVHLVPIYGVFAPVISLGILNLSTMFISYFFVWYYWRVK